MELKDSEKVIQGINALKRHIFYELMNLVGRVFIIVRYHEDVKIGRRGFLPEEKEKGIVLVFNHNMNFQWHEWGIEAKLIFGGLVEHCLIPVEHIIAIYSPEIKTQFFSIPEGIGDEKGETLETEDHEVEPEEEEEVQEKVIKLDFKRKKS